jgi:hypothetical protein
MRRRPKDALLHGVLYDNISGRVHLDGGVSKHSSLAFLILELNWQILKAMQTQLNKSAPINGTCADWTS